MAIKSLNSIAGFSVGEYPTTIIIDSNGNVSTGNLTSSSNVNFTTAGNVALGAVANIHIDGGSSGYYLQTNGSGNLVWAAVPTGTGISNGNSNVDIPVANGNVNLSAAGNTTLIITGVGANVSGTLGVSGNVSALGILTDNIYYANGTPWDMQQPSGSNTQIQFNDNDSFGASANFTFDSDTNVLNVTGNITASNANLGNAVTANFFTGTLTTAAQPNVTSVGTLTGLSVDGANITLANGVFVGSGSGLSSLAGANVTGTVANATFATSAGSATTAETVTTAAQPNITSVGTLTSLAVTGNVDASNITANSTIFAVTANISGNVNAGNVNGTTGAFTSVSGDGANLSSITGANVTGQVGNALVAGTVYTNAQPNITSVGTLSSLDVTANATAGNLIAIGDVAGATLTGSLTTAAQPNVTSVGTLTTLDVTGNITSSANVVTDLIVGRTSSITISATGTDQNVNLVPTGTGIIDVHAKILGNLATPVAATDAATKAYVDSVAEGLNVHASSEAATPNTLAIISGGTVTYNNGTAGVGATLTTTGSYTTIDGVTLVNGDRILVKNEANAAHNGIYVRTSATVLTRADDYNTTTEIKAGDFSFVSGGDLYNSTGWVQIDNVAVIGTDPIVWEQFAGAGTYLAGTGLTLTGDTFSITDTTVTAGAYGDGDSVATFSVNAQGQLTAAANVVITANAANLTGTTLSSTVVNSSLTSVGTLTSLDVTGNVAAANFTGANLVSANFVAGTLTTAAQPNITSVGTLTSLDVTGNVAAGNVSGTNGAFTNVSGNGSALTALTGANVTGQVANALIAGTVYTNAQPNITSVGTLTSLDVTGNVATGNISGTNGNLVTANVSDKLILGNASVTTVVSYSSVTTTATTPNQTIASFPASGVTGVEFLVKAIDSTGSKYSVSTVIVVTDGTTADYSTFGTVSLGGYTGSLAVNVVGANVNLQVTPSSSNSTVWTTQYRFI